MNKYKELIEKKTKLKQLQAEVKELETELLNEWVEKEQVDNYVINKVVRLSYKLKQWVDEQKIAEEYPEATTIKIDVKELVKLWVEKYLEEKETAYLQVKEIK